MTTYATAATAEIPRLTHDRPAPAAPRWPEGTKTLLAVGAALAVVGIIMWIFFGFFTHLGAVGFPAAMLSHFGSVLIGLAGICVIVACTIRLLRRDAVDAAELRAELATVSRTAATTARAAAQLRTALAELPEQIRDRAAIQGKVVAARLDQIERRQGELSGALTDVTCGLAEVGDAVRELGMQLEAVRAQVADTATAEAVMARVDSGTVVPMHPNGGTQHRR